MDGFVNEKACGGVIVRDEKVLMIYQQNGFWGFPKGHVESGEREDETAIREIFEETGIWTSVDTKKRFEFSYDIMDKKIHKTVVLFVAEVVDDTKFKKQDEEIAEMKWVPIDEVKKVLTYDEWKEVWRKIHAVI